MHLVICSHNFLYTHSRLCKFLSGPENPIYASVYCCSQYKPLTTRPCKGCENIVTIQWSLTPLSAPCLALQHGINPKLLTTFLFSTFLRQYLHSNHIKQISRQKWDSQENNPQDNPLDNLTFNSSRKRNLCNLIKTI